MGDEEELCGKALGEHSQEKRRQFFFVLFFYRLDEACQCSSPDRDIEEQLDAPWKQCEYSQREGDQDVNRSKCRSG